MPSNSGVSFTFFTTLLLIGLMHLVFSTEEPESSIEITFDLTTPSGTALTDLPSRSPRLMKILNEHKMYGHTKRAPPRPRPPKVHARADPIAFQRIPISYHRHPIGDSPRPPQLHRRVQNSRPAEYYEPVKSSRYSNSKGGPQFSSSNHNNIYQQPPKFLGGAPHPNAVAPQPHSPQYVHNFKASPHFNGKAIIRPLTEQQFKQEVLIKQYPLPQPHPQHQLQTAQQQQQQQQAQQPQHLNQREQYRAPTEYQSLPQVPPYKKPQPNPIAQRPPKYPEEPLLHERPVASSTNYNNNNNHLPQQHTHYSVYEDSLDLGEQTHNSVATIHSQEQQQQQQPQQQQHLFPDFNAEAAAKEAQDYLKFMNSNDYFLPKRDPNYKKLDADKDQQQQQYRAYQQQQQQQQQQQEQRQLQQQHQEQEQQHHQLQLQDNNQQEQQIKYSKPMNDLASASSQYPHQPPQISELFYQQNPSAQNTAVVHGSYQTGNNVFVVNSDGNKGIKHIVPNSNAPPSSHSASSPTAPPATYSQVRYSSAKSRTPEPVRFEFTERDAIPASYTNSPLLRYKAVDPNLSTPRTPSASVKSSLYNAIKPIREIVAEDVDDPEEGDDMHNAEAPTYGRMPVRSNSIIAATIASTSAAPQPPSEQKDTEEYCEQICANVEDDDGDEIVCGSDNFMYTSEAQMECYASCLHIDVTIQGKGSCTAS